MKIPTPHFLLDSVKINTGTDSATAHAVFQTKSVVADWRRGRQPIPIGDVVLLAKLAGFDPFLWATQTISAPYVGTAKGEQLAMILNVPVQYKQGDAFGPGSIASQLQPAKIPGFSPPGNDPYHDALVFKP